QASPTPRAALPAVGCGGLQWTDPAGDTSYSLVVDLPIAQPDSLDLTAGWFRYEGGVLTANLRVANLDKNQYGTLSTDSIYYMWWTGSDDVGYFVDADNNNGTVSYNYGELGTGVTTDGATKGTFNEGKDGVISIVVPQAATKATEGSTLKSTYGRTVPS